MEGLYQENIHRQRQITRIKNQAERAKAKAKAKETGKLYGQRGEGGIDPGFDEVDLDILEDFSGTLSP